MATNVPTRIREWISYQDALNQEMKQSIGGGGGWFTEGMRWEDYIAKQESAVIPYLETLRESIIRNQVKQSGTWHQKDPNGAPLFEDGTVGLYSIRGWGDLLAAVWSDEGDYDYTDFFM
jgi:hypothetical protein